MPEGVSAYVPLANVTLGSNAATVTFSSISQSYRDLVVVINAGCSTPGNTSIYRINSDSGSNYTGVVMYGSGGSTGAANITSQSWFGSFYGGGWPQTITAMSKIEFLDYSATDKHKNILMRSNRGDNITEAFTWRWANTSAITSITLNAQYGTDLWLAGSTFALYGVSA